MRRRRPPKSARSGAGPNKLNARGQQRDLKGLMESQAKGRAVEATWTGRMTFAMGKTPAGDAITAHFAMFFEMRNGKIWRQRNYDCFEEF